MITVVIPTYKRPQLLKRAVKSVLNQTYPHFTILIADNASGDETDSVVQQLVQKDQRIKLLKQKTNLGMSANFQSAFMQVTTPYVCFLPDDDFYAPTFFEETLSAFSHYPDICFAGGGSELFIDQNHTISCLSAYFKQKCPPTGYYPPAKSLLAHFRAYSGIQFPSSLFKTDCLHTIGGFDVRLKFCIDSDLISKCAARFPVYLITDRIFYFYYQNSTSLSRSFDLQQQEIEAHYLHENILLTPLPPTDRQVIDLWYQSWKMRICCGLYGYYYSRREFQKAYLYAEKLYHMTGAARWKKRKTHTKLYAHFSFLSFIYQALKVCERGLRFYKKKSKVSSSMPSQEVIYTTHSDTDFWKQYALSLET
ncbi:MAG: glycosyltransferase family 2 protein [Verrucomicrobia bacterium]|nr:glycosyltransferase family 2 protein [Verrucomicrobiota bacterium]MBS0645409.1 glycosyltransferase family 2 protein [Verrucomicrobiota bacterium]